MIVRAFVVPSLAVDISISSHYNGIVVIEFIKEKVVKYAKYIGSLNEAIYLTRIDAIQMFENA